MTNKLLPHPAVVLREAAEKVKTLAAQHGWKEVMVPGGHGPLTLTRGNERILCLFTWGGRIAQARKWVGGDAVKINAKEFRALLVKKASAS